MPKAEVGSTKHIANKMKAKGLQRLRWYCQICGKQCRDENGFKQHTQSEGHVRAMLQVGEDPRKYINDFSNQFRKDFLQLLRTAHGEKKVHMNNFYQEYIKDKDHVHMNATKWPSLTEFAKFLGREGICRVEEEERGLYIQWIDDSAEAIRRREDIRKKDQLAKGEEDIESRLLKQQIKRAREQEEERKKKEEEAPVQHTEEKEVKVSLSLKRPETGKSVEGDNPPQEQEQEQQPPTAKISLSSLAASKKKSSNPLAKKIKNPLLAKTPPIARAEPEKKMSNAERIMKEELAAEERGHGAKRQRFN
ncbi:hypothetical protein AC578_8988 [Pseudocercospora eumusae]|uniref:C2H2-type domain-containing protein n=1 Tax=Pseudocercospora eumusae TaxID=321146 RepID=A0A139HA68_9PEZI|nr:hypothetical protein AC578_8988 [Pseudocercospora eumusae]